MTIGDDKGNTAAAIAAAESGDPIAVAAKPKISTCAKVTGIDSVCTSRTVVAIEPIPRNSEPSSR